MPHQLLIDIADDVYQPLLERAQAVGKTPESLASDLIAKSVHPLKPGDLLRRWIGAIDSGVEDAAERHDEYIGQSLYDELHDK
jgi:hypothetical protein